MALALYQTRPTQILSRALPESTRSSLGEPTRCRSGSLSWAVLQRKLKCHGRFSCLFSDNRREEEARRALEGALGGKKSEFEKWDKEIKRREEIGGGGGAGGGGWFGFGGRFGWSNDDNFWQEAQQTSLTVLGILVLYLIIAKGDVMFAVLVNPTLYALRGARNGFSLVTNRILGKTTGNSFGESEARPSLATNRVSAKDRVSKKWGSE